MRAVQRILYAILDAQHSNSQLNYAASTSHCFIRNEYKSNMQAYTRMSDKSTPLGWKSRVANVITPAQPVENGTNLIAGRVT